MALKPIYLILSRLFAWARLAGRHSLVKDVEILTLRHQLAVAQRRDRQMGRKLTLPHRAWLALSAGLLPKRGLDCLWLMVTPGALLG